MTIYLDMDDVLVDFTGGLKKFNTLHDFDKSRLDTHKSQWTRKQIEGDKFVVDCMNTPGFFRDLPMSIGADQLWIAAGCPSILTAWPKTCLDKDRVGHEKREWITHNFGDISDDRFIYCSREDKSKYALGNILVDDMESNIEAWDKAGGYGIVFKTIDQAIYDLKKLLKIGNKFDIV